jgi:hypothetical protein
VPGELNVHFATENGWIVSAAYCEQAPIQAGVFQVWAWRADALSELDRPEPQWMTATEFFEYGHELACREEAPWVEQQ